MTTSIIERETWSYHYLPELPRLWSYRCYPKGWYYGSWWCCPNGPPPNPPIRLTTVWS